jgi:hypothetical protein
MHEAGVPTLPGSGIVAGMTVVVSGLLLLLLLLLQLGWWELFSANAVQMGCLCTLTFYFNQLILSLFGVAHTFWWLNTYIC